MKKKLPRRNAKGVVMDVPELHAYIAKHQKKIRHFKSGSKNWVKSNRRIRTAQALLVSA